MPTLRRVVPGSWEKPVRWHARILHRLDRHDEALTLLETAAARSPAAEHIAVDLGRALAMADRHEEALRHWQQLVETAPANRRVWRGYACLLTEMGRYDQLDELFDRCLNASGGKSRNALLAVKLAQQASPLAIDRVAEEAERRIGDDPEALGKLAKLHVRCGNHGRALQILERLEESGQGLAKGERLRQQMEKTARTLQSVDGKGGSPALSDLRLPEDVLTTMLRLSKPDPLEQRQGLSMAVTTLGPGGAERQLTNTVNGLRSLDLHQDIKIVQTRSRDRRVDGFYQSQFGSPEVAIVAVNDEPIDIDQAIRQRGDHLRALLPLLPRSLKRYICRYMTEFSKTRPQIVHCWSDQRNMTAGIAAVVMGVPRVIMSTRSIAPPGNRAAPRHFPAMYRAMLACPNVRMINNSRAGAASYETWLGIPSGTINVIHNGVDVESIHQGRDPEKTKANRRQLGLADDTRVVGSLLRFSSEKRSMLWLEAAACLAAADPDVQFVLIGDGVEKARAEAYSQELGIADRVHFLGLIKDVVPWYDAFDVVLLTSSREGTSNTVLEAQSLGKPVVATDVGGMGEAMVPGESGFLVSADPSPDEIAERLAFVLFDEDWRRGASMVGEAFIRKAFSIERMTRDTFDLYDLEPRLLKSA